MGEKCLPDELRTLFLFEELSDEQLQTLCDNGHIAIFEPGPVCVEGEPATCFYVMIDGELVMSKRSGGVDIETGRTSQRGVYCGAWSAYIPGEEHVYEASVRVTKPSRFFVLDADAFARLHADRVPDGRASARRAQGRRPAADVRSSASARSCWRSAPSRPA